MEIILIIVCIMLTGILLLTVYQLYLQKQKVENLKEGIFVAFDQINELEKTIKSKKDI